MKLLKITLENFQGISFAAFAFNGHSATIYGENATGKTTVYNALTWLLFDKASTAAKNFTPKTKSAEGDVHHLNHSAEAIFATEDGQEITLKKTYHETYKKKRGSATEEFSGHTVEYEVDGVPVKEKEFASTVTGLCGGDMEKPKLLTMPDYFPEQLPWEARRKILLEICGDISDDEIINGHSELSELRDFLRMNGTAEKYYTIDEYKKISAARRTEINKRLTEIPARIDEANKAIPDTAGLNDEVIKGEIADLEKQKEALLAERAEITTGSSSAVIASLKERLAEAKTRLAEGKAGHAKAESEKNSGIDAEIAKARKVAFDLNGEVQLLDLDIERKKNESARLTAARERLLEEYKKVSAEVWDESQSICPTCHRALPPEDVEKLKSDFNLRKSSRLEEINLRGKTEASKGMIDDLESKITAALTRRTECKQGAETAQAEVERLSVERLQPVQYESTDEYAAQMEEIAELETMLAEEVSNAGVQSNAMLSDISLRILAVDESMNAERDKLAVLSTAKAQQERIKELEQQEKRLGAEFEELEKGLYLCDLFTKAKVSALTDKINGKFKNVRFRLFVEQINGGLKEDCEVMIPSADGRLVPYAFANNAARINAGLEIISTLSDFYGLKMPVFIDNAEAVTQLFECDTQVIRLVVSEPDKVLRLEVA